LDLHQQSGLPSLPAAGRELGFLLQAGVFTEIDAPEQFNTQLGQINKNGWFVGSYENSRGKAFAFYAKPSPGASVLVDSDDEQ
jgi:hypothetical protein